MQKNPLPMETRVAEGADLEVIITHEDLTETTNTTDQIVTIDIAAKMGAKVVRSYLDEPFADSSSTANDSTLVQIGDGGDPDRLQTSTELNENGTEVVNKEGTGVLNVFTADDTIDFTFTPKTGTNLAALDQGRLRTLLKFSDARTPAAAV